jgi:hypothetical protein
MGISNQLSVGIRGMERSPCLELAGENGGFPIINATTGSSSKKKKSLPKEGSELPQRFHPGCDGAPAADLHA